jgi:hypothetical protein
MVSFLIDSYGLWGNETGVTCTQEYVYFNADLIDKNLGTNIIETYRKENTVAAILEVYQFVVVLYMTKYEDGSEYGCITFTSATLNEDYAYENYLERVGVDEDPDNEFLSVFFKIKEKIDSVLGKAELVFTEDD